MTFLAKLARSVINHEEACSKFPRTTGANQYHGISNASTRPSALALVPTKHHTQLSALQVRGSSDLRNVRRIKNGVTTHSTPPTSSLELLSSLRIPSQEVYGELAFPCSTQASLHNSTLLKPLAMSQSICTNNRSPKPFE